MEDKFNMRGYLRALQRWLEAEISLSRILWRYCHVRTHRSSIGGGKTPRSNEVYNQIEPAVLPCPRLTDVSWGSEESVQLKPSQRLSKPLAAMIPYRRFDVMRPTTAWAGRRPEPFGPGLLAGAAENRWSHLVG